MISGKVQTLNLKIRKVDGYWNYDKSEFEGVTLIADDEKIKSVWETQYPLKPFVDVTNFRNSYDELKEKLNRVID